MAAVKTDERERNLKPHSFRHSLATHLADHGHPPEKIRATLGWTNEATRASYTQWGDTDLTGQAQLVDRMLVA